MYCLTAAIKSTAEPFFTHGAWTRRPAWRPKVRANLSRRRSRWRFCGIFTSNSFSFHIDPSRSSALHSFVARSTNQSEKPSVPPRRALSPVQGMLTNLHSESDRIDPTWSANDFDQGVYAMASAYGGTVSRLLLQPLEERARAKDVEGTERANAVLVKLVSCANLEYACLAPRCTRTLFTLFVGARCTDDAADDAADVLCAFRDYRFDVLRSTN